MSIKTWLVITCFVIFIWVIFFIMDPAGEEQDVVHAAIQWQQDMKETFVWWKIKNSRNPPVTIVPGYKRRMFNKNTKKYDVALILSIAATKEKAISLALQWHMDKVRGLGLTEQEVPGAEKERTRYEDQVVPCNDEDDKFSTNNSLIESLE